MGTLGSLSDVGGRSSWGREAGDPAAESEAVGAGLCDFLDWASSSFHVLLRRFNIPWLCYDRRADKVTMNSALGELAECLWNAFQVQTLPRRPPRAGAIVIIT